MSLFEMFFPIIVKQSLCNRAAAGVGLYNRNNWCSGYIVIQTQCGEEAVLQAFFYKELDSIAAP